MSGQFGTGAEMSWVRSVMGPKCLDTMHSLTSPYHHSTCGVWLITALDHIGPHRTTSASCYSLIRLRTATEVIGPISGIWIINDFTICVCLEDADIMLLLRMFYAFLFSSYSSFSPNLRSLLLSGNEHDNLNSNAMSRMVSIRGRLLQNMFNLI